MNKNLFTYKKSGVDIPAAEKFVKFITNISKKNKVNSSFNKIISCIDVNSTFFIGK